jgi:hypothetical protein
MLAVLITLVHFSLSPTKSFFVHWRFWPVQQQLRGRTQPDFNGYVGTNFGTKSDLIYRNA